MAVQLHQEQDGRVLEVRVSRRLTQDDYERFVPVVERMITRHGKIRVLVDMRDFHGWTGGALCDDLRFDLAHFRHIERLAFIDDAAWERGMAVFCRLFTTAQIRCFDRSQVAEARKWLRSGNAGGERS